MLRIATLAAAAAVLVAAPAYADSIHISTVGKSPEQLKTEVTAAATRLCRAQSYGSLFQEKIQATCVTESVSAALGQAGASETMRVSTR